jgi:hypothetical protein
MAPSDPVKSGSTPLPLAHLRRGPGRPRTRPRGDNPGDIRPGAGTQVVANGAQHGHGAEALPVDAPLLDRARAASYLGVGLRPPNTIGSSADGSGVACGTEIHGG